MRYQQPLVYVDAVARAGSIRRAAETLAITSTALNRRILSLEDDVGAPLFERLPNGVRLSAAGELFLHFARRQLVDADRLRARLADLTGERRGHVNVATGQSFSGAHLPGLISEFQAIHPAVTFGVRRCTRNNACGALESFEADLAVVFEPELSAGVEVLKALPQPLHVVCRADHPLTAAPHDGIRLARCLDYPMALPTLGNGVRWLLEQQTARTGQSLSCSIESDDATLLRQSVAKGPMISFEIPMRMPDTVSGVAGTAGTGAELVTLPLDSRDAAIGQLCILRMKGRVLPVAAASFAERVLQALGERSATETIEPSRPDVTLV